MTRSGLKIWTVVDRDLAWTRTLALLKTRAGFERVLAREHDHVTKRLKNTRSSKNGPADRAEQTAMDAAWAQAGQGEWTERSSSALGAPHSRRGGGGGGNPIARPIGLMMIILAFLSVACYKSKQVRIARTRAATLSVRPLCRHAAACGGSLFRECANRWPR